MATEKTTQKITLLPGKSGLYIAAILAALLVVGSVADYPLSCTLYNESNPFGMLLAGYGETPAALGLVAAGALLLAGRSRQNKIIAALQCAGGLLLAAMGTMMVCVMPTLYLPIPPALLAAVGLAISAVTAVVVYRLGCRVERRTALRIAAALGFAIFAEILLVNIIKIPWGRARMRLVANDPRAFFMPWWQAGGELKATLVATGVAAEEFKSFPSGHTANATTAMLVLGLLPLLAPKL